MKNDAAKGACSVCGARVSLRAGWFGEQITEFHGQKGGGSRGRGIVGRCAGSRLPPAEAGAERLAAYVTANAERVAAYSR